MFRLLFRSATRGSACFSGLSFSSVVNAFHLFANFVRQADGWEDRWVKSEWKKEDGTAGEWNHTSGNWSGDAQDKGNRSEYFFFLMLPDFVLFCSVRRMLNS
jgi:hypothetical protein